MRRPALALVAAALAPLALGGCITLFPKEKPADLYRFDATVPAVQSAAAPFTVRLELASFGTDASGDQIMTSNGEQVAYIAGARWSAPAQELFDAAVEHGFDQAGGPAHPMTASAAGKADLRLQLEVTRFEAAYPSGPTAPPTIIVHVRAQLAREKDLVVVATQEFEATAPAADNRVSAIVPAFDQATSKVIGDLVAWVDQAPRG